MKRTNLQRTQELFDFLCGEVPSQITIADEQVPKLTSEQAWAVIWYLGNQYWQVTDHVERCGVCGTLYDSNNAGACLDFGDAPYDFCDECMLGSIYAAKAAGEDRQ